MKTAESTPKRNVQESRRVQSIKTHLTAISQLFRKASNLDDAMEKHKNLLTDILQAEEIRIYKQEIYSSQISSRLEKEDKVKTIQHLLSPDSIAGYTALSRTCIRIENVRDSKLLSAVHPQLKYNKSYDSFMGTHTHSILSIPLLHARAEMGVLQVVNKKGGSGFREQDEAIGKAVAKIIAHKIFTDLKIAKDPFDFLVQQGKITSENLTALKNQASREKKWLTSLLRTELGMTEDEIGESLEKFYRVPFMKFDPDITIPFSLIDGVSRYYLKTRLWVPVMGDPDKAVVLIHDPQDKDKINEVHKLLRVHSYEFRVGLPEDIIAYLSTDDPRDQKREKSAAVSSESQVSMPGMDLASVDGEELGGRGKICEQDDRGGPSDRCLGYSYRARQRGDQRNHPDACGRYLQGSDGDF